MATLDELQARLEDLDAEIASAEKDVTFGDRRVTKRSMAELLEARQHIAAQIAGLQTTPRPRAYQITTSGRGF